jgi:hypothetical protein
MPVELNHTIVHARNQRESATFVAEILGLAVYHQRTDNSSAPKNR